MFKVGDKVSVRFQGESYMGVIKKIKWGIAFIEFVGYKNQWINIGSLELVDEIKHK